MIIQSGAHVTPLRLRCAPPLAAQDAGTRSAVPAHIYGGAEFVQIRSANFPTHFLRVSSRGGRDGAAHQRWLGPCDRRFHPTCPRYHAPQHSSFRARMDPLASPLDFADGSWDVVDGLAREYGGAPSGCISFQSKNFPTRYLR